MMLSCSALSRFVVAPLSFVLRLELCSRDITSVWCDVAFSRAFPFFIELAPQVLFLLFHLREEQSAGQCRSELCNTQ